MNAVEAAIDAILELDAARQAFSNAASNYGHAYYGTHEAPSILYHATGRRLNHAEETHRTCVESGDDAAVIAAYRALDNAGLRR